MIEVKSTTRKVANMSSRAERDFGNGIPIGEISDGAMTQGKVGDEDVIVARRGDEFFAVGAHCPHYGGPLARGLIVGDELRCPLHHRSEEHTSELQSQSNLVCRLLLEKKKKKTETQII